MDQTDLFLAPNGWETPLGEELGRVFPGVDRRSASGLWWELHFGTGASEIPALAFALQSLPNTTTRSTVSIRKDADAVALELRHRLGDVDTWRMHVFAPANLPGVTQGKAKLLRTALLESLKRKAKGLLATVNDGRTSDSLSPLVQVSWISTEQMAVSVSATADVEKWRRCLSLWPGGVAPIADDGRPPSRAYRKLHEALLQMGRRIRAGETIVDLGASPGGWSYVALDAGASVIAVDRSPLRPDLMRNPRLHFVEGDAFRYQPERCVDWMVADVAAYPDRALDLVRTWLHNDWCRSLVATVKFTGTERYGILESFKAMLATTADDFRIRKLLENKNEATIMAWRSSRNRTAGDNPESANGA
jgi:23S rRNA (cytidine2498-2'-O)-methyltransferase